MTDHSRQACANALSRVLADTYVLYLKTHNYHWNVEGPNFRQLHLLFEEQYQDMWAALDDIAERIRALGEYAPGTYAKFAELAKIKENQNIPRANDMLKELTADNEQLVATIAEATKIAQDAGDEPTAGLLTDRQTIHEKAAWMLRSMLA
ncbi:putative DNA-binding stress protein [Oceanimonas sp. GK1]|uniref:Dps family protein n=1 Tax=Oceanimonas sp. (strain GK1 / IBRC-M 10197) TaxID=511062 RepID=UPI0002494E68|nr:Dps family protein [Oceanimonas sp. GK1]AEY02137.1 putative DNA-binding stress protein [Oceanimonas sp. GK1]